VNLLIADECLDAIGDHAVKPRFGGAEFGESSDDFEHGVLF